MLYIVNNLHTEIFQIPYYCSTPHCITRCFGGVADMRSSKYLSDGFKRFRGLDPEAATVVAANHFQVKRCNYPTVFTYDQIDPVINLNDHQSTKQKIFSCGSCYVSPKELKFSLPKEGKAEIAFIGRSNVGKSSLIDHLLSKSPLGQGLVRISKQPGCTKTINFFTFLRGTSHVAHNKDAMNILRDNCSTHDTSSHIAYLVDMPGYGFARADKHEKNRWQEVLESYLIIRNQSVLRRVFILIDGRHGLKRSDVELMLILNNCHISYQIVMTKTDLVKEKDLLENIRSVFEQVLSMKNNTCLPFVHAVSVVRNDGIDTLKLCIAEIISQKWNVIHNGEMH